MPKELGRYDTDLQMFVEKPRISDMNHLRFQRWRAEKQGRTLSIPRGDNVFRLTNQEIATLAMQQADATSEQKLRDHIQKSGDY